MRFAILFIVLGVALFEPKKTIAEDLQIRLGGPRVGGTGEYFVGNTVVAGRPQGNLGYVNSFKINISNKGKVALRYDSVADTFGAWGVRGRGMTLVSNARFFAISGTVDYEVLRRILISTNSYVSIPGKWLNKENGIMARVPSQNSNGMSWAWLNKASADQVKTHMLKIMDELSHETKEQFRQRMGDDGREVLSASLRVKVHQGVETGNLFETKDCKKQLKHLLSFPCLFEPNRFHKWASQHTATEFHSRTNYFKGPDRRACAEAVNALKAKGKRLPLDLPPVRVWAPSLPLSRPFHPYR